MGDAYPGDRARAQRASRRRCASEEERFAETLDRGMASDRRRSIARRRPTQRPVPSTGGSCSRSTTRTASRSIWRRRCSRTRAGGDTARRSAAFERGDGGAARARPRRRDVRRRRRRRRERGASTSGSRRASAKPSSSATSALAAPGADPGAGAPAAQRVAEAAAGDEVEVILDRTPAYAESGGQMGDTGSHGRPRKGAARSRTRTTAAPSSSSTACASRRAASARARTWRSRVESPRRQGLRQHHTGTHLLHAALRRVLGTHVAQAGSLVAPDHLRFDFSHGAVGQGPRGRAESSELVNEQVQANIAGEPVRDGSAGGARARARWRCSARSTATACA